MDREKAVRGAIRSTEMEGFVFTEMEKADFDKLAKGEISYEDMLKKSDVSLERLKREKPEAFLEEK
jgi:hypothetical protein